MGISRVLRTGGLVGAGVGALRSVGLFAAAGGVGRLTWVATRVADLAEVGNLAMCSFRGGDC